MRDWIKYKEPRLYCNTKSRAAQKRTTKHPGILTETVRGPILPSRWSESRRFILRVQHRPGRTARLTFHGRQIHSNRSIAVTTKEGASPSAPPPTAKQLNQKHMYDSLSKTFRRPHMASSVSKPIVACESCAHNNMRCKQKRPPWVLHREEF